ncbi:hypothetical protein GGD46_006713 [Rhizobium lusitanum]|uniref:Uncharacterized protein n=1 Tax=Rhizobium lusitanum TaxID=293958 RepID=A0A7X0IY82_9HYPH|nr:hypothetical protein [Rhizobium lusitanum]
MDCGVKLSEGVEQRQQLVVRLEPTEELLVLWVYLRSPINKLAHGRIGVFTNPTTCPLKRAG